jgi:deazaflavin-dependent oxidoreductase (nitroreductase family)
MAYLKPPAFTQRVFNPLAVKFGLGGTTALVVAGRSTGKPQTIPVYPVEHKGVRYLVSTRGEADWVRNLRAAGKGELRGKQGTEEFRATEVPADQRAPILTAYHQMVGKRVDGYFEKLPDPADHPVFRIEPNSP